MISNDFKIVKSLRFFIVNAVLLAKKKSFYDKSKYQAYIALRLMNI